MRKKQAVMGSQAITIDYERSMVLLLLLPEEIIINQILLKLSVESLLSLRRVSKYFRTLITNPGFVKLHFDHSTALVLISTRSIEHSMGAIDTIRNYLCNFNTTHDDDDDPSHPTVEEIRCPFPSTDIRASCNGLLYVHGRPSCRRQWAWARDNDYKIKKSPSYIWNPCTKEYRVLPPPPPSTLLKDKTLVHFDDLFGQVLSRDVSMCNAGFCGFGYDRTNDEYKILYYEHLVDCLSPLRMSRIMDYLRPYPDERYACTTEFKLYTLETNTWTSLNNDPYKCLYFGQIWQRIGLLVNGALHWIMSSSISSPAAAKAKIISFDLENEEFREVPKPPTNEEYNYNYYGNLQVLQGCLCVCRFPLLESNNEVDIWMLKDYAVSDSWTMLFRVAIPDAGSPVMVPEHYFKLLRLCKNGEIVLWRHSKDLIVYDPVNCKARRAEKFEEAVKKYWDYQMDYTKSLVSVNSGTYTI